VDTTIVVPMDIRVKKHTLKSQVVIDQETKEIICTAHDKGKEMTFAGSKPAK